MVNIVDKPDAMVSMRSNPTFLDLRAIHIEWVGGKGNIPVK
jgi:hypothetical protein